MAARTIVVLLGRAPLGPVGLHAHADRLLLRRIHLAPPAAPGGLGRANRAAAERAERAAHGVDLLLDAHAVGMQRLERVIQTRTNV